MDCIRKVGREARDKKGKKDEYLLGLIEHEPNRLCSFDTLALSIQIVGL